MLFIQAITALSAMRATFVNAGAIPIGSLPDAPESALVARGSRTDSLLANSGVALEKRQNYCGPGEILVYRFPNTSGSYALLCTSGYVVAGCYILIASGTISSLVNTIVGWVQTGRQDASAAGPPAKVRDTPTLTWGELYNYTLTVPTEAGASSVATAATNAGLPVEAVTTMAIHKDGFSASFDLSKITSSRKIRSSPASPLHVRQEADCFEQMHVHYWAAAGHATTALDGNGINNLVSTALSDSYNANYSFACYELSNGGAWDGWIRVCYNGNTSQVGCGYCGGHVN